MKNSKLIREPFSIKKVFLSLVVLFFAVGAYAQTAMVTNNFVYYPKDADVERLGNNYQCTMEELKAYEESGIHVSSVTANGGRSFVLSSMPNGYNTSSNDPWVNSALIEYDNVFTKENTTKPFYPNHCLTLCAEVTCSNPPRMSESAKGDGSDTNQIYYVRSGDFPIQTILFDIFKYQKNANPYSPDSTPPIRTIAMYPDGENVKNICYGVGVPDGASIENTSSCCDMIDFTDTCINVHSCKEFNNQNDCNDYAGCHWYTGVCMANGYCQSQTSEEDCLSTEGVCRWNTSNSFSSDCTGPCQTNCLDTLHHFTSKERCEAGISKLNFCTAWDGSYEIDGEFGKSNGQFGYRTTIKTNFPGDDITISGEVNIEHMIVYPGDSQVPIQVDVTNVHSVRSTPTLIGSKASVTAQPYRLRYRLSKDATMSINIMDAYENANGSLPDPTSAKVVRHLVKGLPRDGEGFQGGGVGNANDIIITNEDTWDGRDDEGRLLPYGNYLVSLQASTRDEWTGMDYDDLSRAVTRQLSLDPLKITDFGVQGLGKTSTAYAMLSYMLTEPATVHVEIFTPGTTFEDLNICKYVGSSDCSGASYKSFGNSKPVIKNNSEGNPTGMRVAEYIEQKASRVNVNTKWDGMCWDKENCKNTTTSGSTTANGYTYGGALPDGDYVYVIWAGMPYGSTSGQPNGTFDPQSNFVEINGVKWDGVKTKMMYNGILPINRGNPEITIDPVSYSTVGSSPIANGLDPFVFSYSLARDSYVNVGIYTTAAKNEDTAGVCETSGGKTECAPFLVKTILKDEVQEALTKNTYTWDGLDDNGRYVNKGVYMLRIEAKDSLFPEKSVVRTIEFPVDMFRTTDVVTTPLIESASTTTLSGQASISYMLSKPMDVAIRIYDKDVVIPNAIDAWPPVSCQAGNISDECIHYVAGSTSTTYPIKPIKEFTGVRQGEGYTITEFWDGYRYSTSSSEAQEILPDGLYPFVIISSTTVNGAEYYNYASTNTTPIPQNGAWHTTTGIYSSDRPTGYLTISRGPVYFSLINIQATRPTQVYSSETVLLPAYEIQFSVTRSASVKVEVRSTVQGACLGSTTPAGTVCRTLTQTRFNSSGTELDSTSVYDGGIVNTVYWDGKDSKGEYVKTNSYEVRFTAAPYPAAVGGNTVQDTIESRNLSVNNFQVFDRYIWDVTKQNNEQGKFAYQISAPMKVAIQIFKPGTKIANINDGTLINPVNGAIVGSSEVEDYVLVKAIIGARPNLVPLEEIWDGTDMAGQKVPDGVYPFRYVTVTDTYKMDSLTGAVITGTGTEAGVQDVVADWNKYVNLEVINVANGDSWYADLDWKSNAVTMFYPNPLTTDKGYFEITKVPAPGTVSIKIYNIAGDLVREGGYDCMNAMGSSATLEQINATGGLYPDWNKGVSHSGTVMGGSGRNFALRCEWDRTNNHGKRVARGLYYAIMTLHPTRGNAETSQKVVKILIP